MLAGLECYTPEDVIASFQEALLKDWQNSVSKQNYEEYEKSCREAGLI